jgi:hypothetical protein
MEVTLQNESKSTVPVKAGAALAERRSRSSVKSKKQKAKSKTQKAKQQKRE